jgi:hypothetical protein
METGIDAIRLFIADELEQLAADFIEQRKSDLLRKKVRASGDLTSDMDFEVDRQAREDAVVMLLAFEEHGRFIDMKHLDGAKGGDEYVDAIRAWIRLRGWEDKFIEAFKNKHPLRKVPHNLLTRIAWGIIRKRSLKIRPRRWWNSTKTAWLGEVYNVIASQLPDRTLAELTKSFKS